MSKGDMGRVLRRALDRLGASAEAPSDAQLLTRFLRQRDDSAFAALVERHGPMVRGVCRRVLGNEHDADDAFQAVFLVLAEKAGTVRKQDTLGGWLHGVATHVARRARERRQVRQRHEHPAEYGHEPPDAHADAAESFARRELLAALDSEIDRLPAEQNRVLVLHYFEGRSHVETARELGCPAGSIWWRLEQAREGLRSRLTARGLSIPAAALAALLAETASAAVPRSLIDTTTRAALAPAAGGAAAALSGEILAAMSTSKLKWLSAALVLIVTAGAGVHWMVRREPAPASVPVVEEPRVASEEKASPPAEPNAKDLTLPPPAKVRAEPLAIPDPPPLPANARVGKSVRNNVANLGVLLARREARARGWAMEIGRQTQLDDLMGVFRPRRRKHTDADPPLGIGPTAGKVAPDGIEQLLFALETERAPYIDPALLVETAYRIQAVAEVTKDMKAPFHAMNVAWKKYTTDFQTASVEFTTAARSGDAPTVRQAVRKLNATCAACHNTAKETDGIASDIAQLSTDKVIELLKIDPPADDAGIAVARCKAGLRVLSARRLERAKTVPVIVDALTSRHEDVRIVAVSSLKALGESDQTGQPALDRALASEPAAFRYRFAHQVRRLASPTAACAELLESARPADRVQGANLLAVLGEAAMPLKAKLEKTQKEDVDPDVRFAAGETLRHLGDRTELPALLQGLRDPDPLVRGRSAQALAKLGGPAVPGLRAALASKDRDVRVSAISALGRVGPPAKEAADDLRALLQNSDPLLQTLAADALKRIEPPRP